MIRNENKTLKYISLLWGVFTIGYMWFYNYFFIPNPLYGDNASTASNVGRDHQGAFIVWGFMISISLTLNLLYAFKKFNFEKKLPRIMCLLSNVSMLFVVLCKNEKLKRFSFSLSYDICTAPTYTSDYDEQTIATSQQLISGFISKKSLHSAFSLLFGLFIAFSLFYFLICKAKENSNFAIVAVAFSVWVIISALYLKNFLSGTSETVILSITMIGMLVVNNTNLVEKRSIQA